MTSETQRPSFRPSDSARPKERGQSGTTGGGAPLAGFPTPPPEPAPFTDLQWQYFKRRLKESWGVDLDGYREERIPSRIQSWMRRHRIPSLEELVRRLETDEALYDLLQDALFINTSNFFRDDGVFVPLQDEILSALIRKFGRLNIWSAGCSFGAEPYTIAILLWEMHQGGHHRILGTDVDTSALREAEEGVFQPHHLDRLPSELRRKYFKEEDGRAIIDPRVKQGVEFRRHDLLRDPVPGRFELILCRNVLIYFTPAAQQRVLRQLAAAVPVGGYVILGGTEGILDPQSMGLTRELHAIYRKDFDPATAKT